jgi:hypothetical protein
MKKLALLTALTSVAMTSLAAAQDGPRLWTDLAETRSLDLSQQGPEGRGRGGQVVEEWYTPTLHASVAIYGRVSWPSNTNVTVDGLWWSDFFNPGWGVSVEGDLLQWVTPAWGVGGYLSVGWDRFDGQRVNFINGDFAQPDHMDLTSVIIGGKIVDRFNPFFGWDGHIGIGVVHYSSVHWSGFDITIPGPFTHEELFAATTTIMGEFTGRFIFGSPHVEGDLGFGFRIMAPPNRGRDVTTAIDPDVLTTFMIELGLTVRF